MVPSQNPPTAAPSKNMRALLERFLPYSLEASGYLLENEPVWALGRKYQAAVCRSVQSDPRVCATDTRTWRRCHTACWRSTACASWVAEWLGRAANVRGFQCEPRFAGTGPLELSVESTVLRYFASAKHEYARFRLLPGSGQWLFEEGNATMPGEVGLAKGEELSRGRLADWLCTSFSGAAPASVSADVHFLFRHSPRDLLPFYTHLPATNDYVITYDWYPVSEGGAPVPGFSGFWEPGMEGLPAVMVELRMTPAEQSGAGRYAVAWRDQFVHPGATLPPDSLEEHDVDESLES